MGGGAGIEGKRSSGALRAVLFTAGLIALSLALQFSTSSLGSVDGYFHVRYSALLWEAGWRSFPIEFPWLPYTILNARDYYDHHMLFHVWLAPFTALDPLVGGKLAAALGAAAAFASIYGLLRRWRVEHPEWWTIAIVFSAPGFPYRMEMSRVQALSVVSLLAAFHFLEHRRLVALGIVACIYTWLYNAFPFLLALAVASALAGAARSDPVDLRPLGVAALGVAVGLVINPYFPNDLRFIAHHYLGKVWADEAVRVGAEWSPLPVHPWLGWAFPLAVISAALAALWKYRGKLERGAHVLWLMGLGFFLLTWRSERFVEYLVPFGGLAVARTFHGPVAAWLQGGMRRRRLVAASVVAWALVCSGTTVWLLRGRPPVERYARAAAWIRENVPAGSVVFTSDWDDFPNLFYHDPTHRYVVGLDPTYLSRRDPELYRRWLFVATGRDPIPARTIRDVFDAPVAVTDHYHPGFVQAMDRDPRAERVHEDRWGIVYRIADVEPLGRAKDAGEPREERKSLVE